MSSRPDSNLGFSPQAADKFVETDPEAIRAVELEELPEDIALEILAEQERERAKR